MEVLQPRYPSGLIGAEAAVEPGELPGFGPEILMLFLVSFSRG
jgi:hypothetical protein